MVLPPAVSRATDTTFSVGLPSLSASTHVPTIPFSFSNVGLAGAAVFAAGSWERAPAPRATTTTPQTSSFRIISYSRWGQGANRDPAPRGAVYSCAATWCAGEPSEPVSPSGRGP